MIGWIIGDLAAWSLVHPRVRRESEEMKVATLPALLGTTRHAEKRIIIVLGGLMTLVLLGVYAAAQLKAGSTALQTLFGWQPQIGAVFGAVIVVLYCFSGGIRASLWADMAQSIVMMLAMATLLIAASFEVGSPSDVWNNLKAQDPELVNWFPRELKFGFAMYLLGMTFGGFGVIGQPHILVRFMTIRSVDEIQQAKWIYFLWYIPFFGVCIAVGLYARAYMPDLLNVPLTEGLSESQATELAIPEMARRLLPDVLIGLTLAGLFSATMSTADSQILVYSGAITQDINPIWKESYIASKVATLAVTGLALSVALFSGQGVFSAGLDRVVRPRCRTRPTAAAPTTRHPAVFIDNLPNDDSRRRDGHRVADNRLRRIHLRVASGNGRFIPDVADWTGYAETEDLESGRMNSIGKLMFFTSRSAVPLDN